MQRKNNAARAANGRTAASESGLANLFLDKQNDIYRAEQ